LRETASDSFSHGFLFDHGVYTSLDHPNGFSTFPNDINDKGDIVGWTMDYGIPLGFILKDGVFADYDVPGYEFGSMVSGVNSKGEVTGTLHSSGVDITGFVDDGRTLTVFKFPSSTITRPTGINDRGQVVGSYIVPGQSIIRGFIAE